MNNKALAFGLAVMVSPCFLGGCHQPAEKDPTTIHLLKLQHGYSRYRPEPAELAQFMKGVEKGIDVGLRGGVLNVDMIGGPYHAGLMAGYDFGQEVYLVIITTASAVPDLGITALKGRYLHYTSPVIRSVFLEGAIKGFGLGIRGEPIRPLSRRSDRHAVFYFNGFYSGYDSGNQIHRIIATEERKKHDA